MAGENAARGWEYDPLVTQRRFHGDLRSRYKGYSGPVGSGKSRALAYEAIFLAQMNPGLPGLIGAPTFPMLRDSTQKAIFDVLELEGISFNSHKSENRISLPENGSEIWFRSVDHFERLRGTNLAWFGIDELTFCKEESWLRLEARLRHPEAKRLEAFAAWTPNGFDWVYRRFIEKPLAEHRAYLASPRENFHVGDLYKRLASSYDERFYRQEVLGEYLSVRSGQVYYAFDRMQNVKLLPYDRRFPIVWSLDFNINPMCSIIGQMIGSKADLLTGERLLRFHVLDELFISDCRTEQACEEFLNRIQPWIARNGSLIVNVYGDAAGNHRQTAAGAGSNSDWATVKQILGRHPELKVAYKYKLANPAVKDRAAAVNAQLRNSLGERNLFLSPQCERLRRDLEQVSWKPGSSLIDKDADPMLTHISDALGYWIDSEAGIRENGGPRATRLQ